MSVRSRLVAWFALTVFVGSLGLPLAVRHLAWDDDLGDGRPISGHPAAQVDAGQPSASSDHCALCHFWRAMGSAAAGLIQDNTIWLQPDELREAAAVPSPDHLIVRDRPSRAPPASAL